MKTVFSGIQPTGDVHLGNYLGAIRNWVKYQEDTVNMYCIANLHAIANYESLDQLRERTRRLFVMLVACGLDGSNSKIFVQSRIDYHPALAWILTCSTNMGELNRMTQFKDKAGGNSKGVSVGLFSYPVLMAADILLYQSDLVPVGSDQKQHLELARDIAMRFNSRYGQCFKVPEPVIASSGARVMSLDNPKAKMSKSTSSEDGIIYLLDSKDTIVRKIKKATTDSMNSIEFDESRSGVYNLLSMYECVNSKKTREEIVNSFRSYAELKMALADCVYEELKPIQCRYHELMKEGGYVDEMMEAHEEYIRDRAKKTYEKAKRLVGLT